ncbi:MAG TPA: T9SS type A sorting domain-containing protein [Ignavibacteria bacterium]|nr:T9SS type A sorting domain-containing protein [Ignavibacteria bacterium]HMQ98314.1 T9SS type A sorting domain-containing protein [Ignavibacteria bacterium]
MIKFLIFSIVLTFSLSINSQSWVPAGNVTSPGTRPSISVCGINSAYIADGSQNAPKVFRTTNGGLNWLTVPVGGITNEIYCVWAINDNLAFVGEGYVNGNANLYKTTNAGANWSSILTTGSNNGHFTGLAFTKINGNLFALAIAEKVYRSSNSGNNWVELSAGVTGVSNAQNSLMIVDNDFYGFGLNNGAARIRLTTNNSTSWTTQQISVSGNYTSAIAFHSNKLYGVAATSTSLPMISRTTDGGQTWSSVNIGSGVTGTCYLVWVPATPVVYILGENGGIKRSTDNGISWVTTPTPGVTNLTHFDFHQQGMVVYGYAVSSNGNVIKLADTLNILTGINSNSNIPGNFSLEQNYPNPFNPSTLIKYSVAENVSVRLSVYDVLGREVAVPVNEFKTAGSYEVSFNGDNLGTGVYYYRIDAGSFTETKKMLMIK